MIVITKSKKLFCLLWLKYLPPSLWRALVNLFGRDSCFCHWLVELNKKLSLSPFFPSSKIENILFGEKNNFFPNFFEIHFFHSSPWEKKFQIKLDQRQQSALSFSAGDHSRFLSVFSGAELLPMSPACQNCIE